MLALIAGTGDLPPALLARLPDRPLVCALQGFVPAVPADVVFRLEHLGSFLQILKARGVTSVCMAGAVRRPQIDPAAIDAATMPLVPQVQAALAQGDDGALRVIISLFENAGFSIVAAHEVAPDLLPPAGVPTIAQPAEPHRADAAAGEACVAAMGRADIGQACVIRKGAVQAVEDAQGTDAMLARLLAPDGVDPLADLVDLGFDLAGQALDWLGGEDVSPAAEVGGILFKAPKPGQDRRADLPLIGPATAARAVEAGLSGIVIEQGGVMVLEPEVVCRALDAHGIFLWVRPRGTP